MLFTPRLRSLKFPSRQTGTTRRRRKRPDGLRLGIEALEDRTMLSVAPDFEWVRQFGTEGPATDLVSAVDADGNVYVGGNSNGSFTSADGVAPLPGSATPNFVRKYDSSGTEVWTRQFGRTRNDEVNGIAVDASGVYVVGHKHLGNDFSIDGYVRKYDSNGTLLWGKRIDTFLFDEANAVAVDASGVYVAGTWASTEAFVFKYTLDGLGGVSGTGRLWTRVFGTSSRDQALAISVDTSGVYVAGETRGTFTSADGVVQTSSGNWDAFVRQYDSNGNELWTRQFGTSFDDSAQGVSVDASGVYVAGLLAGDAFVRKFNTSGTELWNEQFGTSATSEDVFGISVDDSGVYVAGRTFGTLTSADGVVQTSAGSRDAFVRKYDSGGTELWTRQFGTLSTDEAFGISVDASGVYVAGETRGTFTSADGVVQTSSGSRDAFVRQYNFSGDELWTRQFGAKSSRTDTLQAADADGNVYVVGSTNGTLPGQTNGVFDDAFVRKYDSGGTELWTRQFGGISGAERALGISVDASGVYVAGRTTGTFPGETSAGFFDAFVRKYELNGTELWTRQFGTISFDQALDISVDASGVYVAGETSGTLTSADGVVQTSTGGIFDPDAFVRKFDFSGTELWTRQFGGSSADRSFGISVDASGVYLAGNTLSTLTSADGVPQTSAGAADAYVRKYDVNGTELWTRQFGGSSSDQAFGISVDASGVYLTGGTRSTLTSADGVPQTSAGSTDAFVRKYDSGGTEVWTRQFGTSSTDNAQGISVDASGVYLAGDTRGALPGQTSAGSTDAFVRKYTLDGSGGTDSNGLVWTRQFGTSQSDFATGISVDGSGVYVVGSTNGALPGQTSTAGPDAFVARLNKRDVFTPVGSNVVVDPADTTTGTSPTELTFSTVTEAGETSLTTSSEGPATPSGFSLGDPATYYELTTTAVFSGSVTICIDYSGISISGSENELTLNHFEDTTGDGTADTWVDATVSLDTEANIICASVSSLSPFAIFEPVLPVQIDIKPGSFPNSINLGSNGTIPVAILSAAEFDATTIDPLTVTLAEAKTRLRGQGTPMASTKDVNGDGLLDLVVHVETEALQLTETDAQAELVGQTFAGVSIQGFDTIRVVAALHVAGGPAEGVIVADGLTDATLNPVVEQSLAHWASAGVDPHRLDVLRQVDVQIADLSDSLLGVAALDVVWIDRDAAGYGWSVNSGDVDLFSAVTHEFGHVLGFEHDVMGQTLGVGDRYRPTPSLILGSFAGDVYGSASDLAVNIGSRDQVFGRLGETRSSRILGAPSGGWLRSTPATVSLSRDRFFGALAAEPDHVRRLDDDWTAAGYKEEADLFDRLFDKSQRRRGDSDADSENLNARLLDEDVLDELALVRLG